MKREEKRRKQVHYCLMCLCYAYCFYFSFLFPFSPSPHTHKKKHPKMKKYAKNYMTTVIHDSFLCVYVCCLSLVTRRVSNDFSVKQTRLCVCLYDDNMGLFKLFMSCLPFYFVLQKMTKNNGKINIRTFTE